MVENSLFDRRHTVRMYTDQPVQKDVLFKVLADAQKAPSWANSQPWEVYVAVGEPLARLKAANIAAFEKNEPGDNDSVIWPEKWPEKLQTRMNRTYKEIFEATGVARDNEQARRENWKNNYNLFNAPAAVFLCLDESLTEWSTLDLGIYAGNLMLAANAHGLGTTPAASSVKYANPIRDILGIPDHYRIMVGIMIGYENKDHPYNRPRTSRVPVEEAVHFRGL